MANTKLLGSDKQNKEKQQKQAAKAKKPRRGPIKYIKEVINELKKVTWPTFRNLCVATAAVVIFVVIVAVLIGAFDFGLTKLLELVVG